MAKEKLRLNTGVAVPTDQKNPFNSAANFYPPQQTPIDLLHTLSLGVNKYCVLHAKRIFQKQKHTPASRKLQAAAGKVFAEATKYQSHHSVTPYQFMWHCGSMNAKDFKVITQVAPFLYSWIQPDFLPLWISLATLNKLCYDWHYEDKYDTFVLLSKAVGAVQKLYQAHMPKKVNSSKLHLLVHLPYHFLVWGPLSLYSVEVPEHLNGDVRHSIVNSNRHNSSRDTAQDFSVREQLLHLMR
ncbi:hypothetical protein HDU80_004738, partial [Chytriomyces hyalinus]